MNPLGESLIDQDIDQDIDQEKRPLKGATPYCKIPDFFVCCYKLILNWLRNRVLADVTVAAFSIAPTTPASPGVARMKFVPTTNCASVSVVAAAASAQHRCRTLPWLGDEIDNERLRHLAALNMARLVKRESRKATFIDLVGMVTAGFGDSDEAARDNEVLLHHTAVHEAGHAAVAIVDSSGKNTPEYSTIVARKDVKVWWSNPCLTALPGATCSPTWTLGTRFASLWLGVLPRKSLWALIGYPAGRKPILKIASN